MKQSNIQKGFRTQGLLKLQIRFESLLREGILWSLRGTLTIIFGGGSIWK